MGSLKDSMIVHKPQHWQSRYGNPDGKFDVSRSTEEYDQVVELINSSLANYGYRVSRVIRVQNYNFYCQFLCRHEYYARSPENYYMVRRFLLLPESALTTALEYNLDPRRLDMNKLRLHRKINSYVYDNFVLLIVNVMTSSPNDDYCCPCRSTDYYIEYIVYFD